MKFAHSQLLVVALALFGPVFYVRAERPPCYELLPAKTLAYIRIVDVREMVARFDDTSIGRMMQEQQLSSLTSRLFEEAEAAFEGPADRLGLTLSDLLKIPQGEITLALVTPPGGLPAGVLMMDIAGQQDKVRKIWDLADVELESRMTKSEETIRGTDVTIFAQEDPRWTGVIRFQRDNMLVVCTNLDVTKQILAAWAEDDEQPILRENEDFADIMRRSKGPRDETPHIRWFVDPISLAKVALRGNFAAQAGLATLPVVGADGILALGGSITFAPEEYDSFLEAHLITAEPRTGVLSMLAMEEGDATPEDWVPHDVASYQTMFWNIDQTKEEFQKLYDSFRGEDAFLRDFAEKSEQDLGVNMVEAIQTAWGGRLSLTTWFEKPARPDNVAYLGGIRLAEDHDVQGMIQRIIEKRNPELEEKSYGGVSYFAFPGPGADEADAAAPLPLQISFGVVDDYLLIANRPAVLERGIVTRSASAKSLAGELDFKLTASKLRRQKGGKTPGRFTFERPEESFRMMYDLATADSTREMLSAQSEGNQLLGSLNSALNDHPLPPFSVLRKYFAPTGSILTRDDSGFHYTGFGLRRK